MDESLVSGNALGNLGAQCTADPSPYPLPQGEGKQLQVLDATLSQDAGKQQQQAASSLQETGKQRAPQIWQQVSGLRPETEQAMSRSERRFAIRKLFRDFERRAREALSEHEKDEVAGERTYLWTPLESICFELGIARRKLSALTKELTGMSAQEVIDRVRAESLRQKIAAKLQRFADGEFERVFASEEKAYRQRAVPTVHDEWKHMTGVLKPEQLAAEKQEARALAEAGMRPEPKCGWDEKAGSVLKWVWELRREEPAIAWAPSSGSAARQAFARELGFATYQRLYRACMLSAGCGPLELEHAMMVARFRELEREHAPKREAIRDEMLKG